MGARVRGGWLAGVLSVRAVPSIRAILFVGAVLCAGFVPGFMAKAAAGRCDAKKDGEVNSPLHGDSKEPGSRSGWDGPTGGGVNANAKGAAQEGIGEKHGSKDPVKDEIRKKNGSEDPRQDGIRQKNGSKDPPLHDSAEAFQKGIARAPGSLEAWMKWADFGLER